MLFHHSGSPWTSETPGGENESRKAWLGVAEGLGRWPWLPSVCSALQGKFRFAGEVHRGRLPGFQLGRVQPFWETHLVLCLFKKKKSLNRGHHAPDTHTCILHLYCQCVRHQLTQIREWTFSGLPIVNYLCLTKSRAQMKRLKLIKASVMCMGICWYGDYLKLECVSHSFHPCICGLWRKVGWGRVILSTFLWVFPKSEWRRNWFFLNKNCRETSVLIHLNCLKQSGYSEIVKAKWSLSFK